MQVTIDGPAGSGKTSVGRKVAGRFSFLFIQSGQLYRALAYGKINSLNYETLSLDQIEKGEPQLILDGQVIEEGLESESVGEEASKLAKRPAIRKLVNDRIQRVARNEDVLVEGRDIGTEVLPDAELKVFLTASARERAKRRREQLETDRPLEEIEADIKRRDERDEDRDIAPLKPAEEAVVIDTTELSQREVIMRINQLIEGVITG